MTDSSNMNNVTEREPATPVPNASITTWRLISMTTPATVTTNIALSRSAKPTTTTAIARKTHTRKFLNWFMSRTDNDLEAIETLREFRSRSW